MKETVRARPTLICERLKHADEDEGGDEVEAEVLGGKVLGRNVRIAS